jgi:hypothetical protein
MRTLPKAIASISLYALALSQCTPQQELAISTAAANAAVVACQSAYPKDATKQATCVALVNAGTPLATAIIQAQPATASGT